MAAASHESASESRFAESTCCGHSHEASVVAQPNVKGGRTWLVNRGTVAGLGAPASWMLADLATLTFDVRPLQRDTPSGG